MAHLGEFGRELADIDEPDDVEDDTFTFHGVTFTLRRSIGALPVLRYAHRAVALRDAADVVEAAMLTARTPEEIAAVRAEDAGILTQAKASLYEFLRSVIGEEQWPEFEKVADRVAADQSELLEVSRKVTAAVAARPTRRPSGSPGGPSPSGRGSGDASPSTDSQQDTSETDEGGDSGPAMTEREAAIAQFAMVPLDVAATRSGN